MKKITIIGGAGLTGKELIYLLNFHEGVELDHISSDKVKGKKISEVFPGLRVKKDLVFEDHTAEIPKDSLVVLAVPNQASMDLTETYLQKGHKLIDLSGVFRLHDKEKFETFYKMKHSAFSLMEKVVFGLPEIFRDKIKNADFVSNPGCYSTSAILPLFGLSHLREAIQFISIDAKSGVSGAGGRVEDAGFSFNSVYENFRAYKILSHQHTPEIQEYAQFGLKADLPEIVFTPHLLPVYRGILSTIVVYFSKEVSEEEVHRAYSKLMNEKFVRYYKRPEDIQLANIQNTNYLDFSFQLKGKVLVIVSALDNLVKGAAGQALQNINLMLGMDETRGLL
ncbi:MAG: N-acetyl-gamma-glutamyl-phosphate reductase [Leptospiraceae bacterium]|nr:N-acetyl-gamma-glutamyl-phosphate reductase [Leptospiraceae bacterium]MCP5501809.1 N-acetyl-gamma-glutamyl-phosphate reductase [Leptospiraceae bacterium]